MVILMIHAHNDLDSIVIDRNEPIPLYYQLKEGLKALVQQVHEGDPIPTEREIGDRFQVSRITVRRAINELVREGYLITQRGKGTFVTRPKIERKITPMQSFSAAMSDTGHRPSSKLLSLRQERASQAIADLLHVEPDSWLWVVERLRLADNDPVALSLIYLHLPPELVLTREMLEQAGSLWAILEQAGVELVRSDEAIQAVAADDQQADLLEVEPKAPLLLIEGTVYTADGTPLEYHRIFNRGDMYTYRVEVNKTEAIL